jgi:hypothetical protein
VTGRVVVQRDLVTVACAISAGIHAALAPGHFAEGTAAGAGFLASAALLAALAVALTLRPGAAAPLAGTAVVCSGLIVAYALTTTTGLPLLHPDAEPVDGLGLFTKAVEALGLLAASDLLLRGRPAVAPSFTRRGGTVA